MSEYPSLPTVLSGNISTAAVSVNEVKRMDRCPHSSPPHLSGPIQSPHPIVLVQLLRFGAGALLFPQHPAPGGGALQKTKAQGIVSLSPSSRRSNSSFLSLGVCAALSPLEAAKLGPLIICQKR